MVGVPYLGGKILHSPISLDCIKVLERSSYIIAPINPVPNEWDLAFQPSSLECAIALLAGNTAEITKE